MKDMDLEKNYQQFLEVNRDKTQSNIFTLLHLQWCLENIDELPNEIHLHDSLGMISNPVDFTREKELYILAISLFIIFWIIRGSFPEKGDEYLDEIGEYGKRSEDFQGDIAIIVMFHFFRCGALFVKGDSDGAMGEFQKFEKLTADFGKEEDLAFIRGFKKNLSKKDKIMSLYRERAVRFMQDHIDYIQRIMRRTAGQIGNLNPATLEAMLSSLEKGDADSLMDIMKKLKDSDGE